MAKQCGEIVLIGTIDNLCFYERNGQYYVRLKPGPDRKTFLKSAKYKSRKQACEWMVRAARITSAIYSHIPKEKKLYQLYCSLQKKAFWMLKEKRDQDLIISAILDYLREEHILHPDQPLTLSFPPLKNKKEKHIDHFCGVKVRTKEGTWIRLYTATNSTSCNPSP